MGGISYIFGYFRKPFAIPMRLSNCSSLNPYAIEYSSVAFEGLLAFISKKSFGEIPR